MDQKKNRRSLQDKMMYVHATASGLTDDDNYLRGLFKRTGHHNIDFANKARVRLANIAVTGDPQGAALVRTIMKNKGLDFESS
ncbi:MAG: hypothetical protein K9G62_07855 [Alphaproteobacteria bacterium]|nr:hypothetical protein [Alphaproteobacteria bacterium]